MPLSVFCAENLIFQVDSNGGAPAQNPGQLATNGAMLHFCYQSMHVRHTQADSLGLLPFQLCCDPCLHTQVHLEEH